MNKLDINSNLEEAAWAYYDKNKPLIPHELDLHKEMISFFIAGAQWQKDTFIEKTYKFFDEHLWEYINVKNANCDTFINIDGDKLIEDFKKYMKGE